MSQHPLLFVLLSSLLSTVQCWPSGYTQDMCVSLNPPDGSPQDTPSPYSITLTGAKYHQGGEVKVEITGTKNVVGFILQARKADRSSTVPIGTWGSGPSQTKTIQCQAADDTKTHSSTSPKGTSPKFTWKAPPDCSKGPIKFYATVAFGKFEYWMGIESDELPCSTEGTTTTPAPPPPTTTTPEEQQPTEGGGGGGGGGGEPTTAEAGGGGGEEETTTTAAGEQQSTTTAAEEQQSTTESDNNGTATTARPSGNGSGTIALCRTLLLACCGLIAFNGV